MLTIVLARSGKAIYFTCLVAWWSFWFFDLTPFFFWFGEATEPPFLGPCFIIFLEELSRTCTQVSMCVCVWFVQTHQNDNSLFCVAKVGVSLNATALSFNVSFDQPSVRFVSFTTTTEACICVYTSRWVHKSCLELEFLESPRFLHFFTGTETCTPRFQYTSIRWVVVIFAPFVSVLSSY